MPKSPNVAATRPRTGPDPVAGERADAPMAEHAPEPAQPADLAASVAADQSPRRRPAAPAVPRLAWLIGPALVAGVAYLDPGNVASNMTAGAQYGYLLVWVVVLGNVMAWLIQYLSAKLGIVTGRSLPEVLGGRIRNRWARRAYWLQAELVAMATDLAEVIGGAVALYLLFGIPLIWGGVITGTVSIVLLILQSRRGPRTFEFVIMGLLMIITIGFTVGVFVAPPDPAGLVAGLVPALRGRELSAARRVDPRRDHHAARHLRALGAEPRPVRDPPGRAGRRGHSWRVARLRHPARHGCDPGAAPRYRHGRTDGPADPRHPPGRVDRHGDRRNGEPLHPPACGREPLGRRGHRQPRGRLRRLWARRSGRPSRRSSRSGSSLRVSPRPRSAPTPAPRSCTACCACGCR